MLVQVVGIKYVLRVVIKRSECSNCRDEHAHWVGVVVESIDEPLSHVLVNHRVVGDVVIPLCKLVVVRQFAIEKQVCNFEERRLLG